MDAAITNNTTETVFIPGPNIEIAAGASKTWANITLAALDTNEVIKSGLVSGDLSVAMTPDTQDAAQATQSGKVGLVDPVGGVPAYTVATLPTTGVFEGQMAFATDGRKTGEVLGAGTGALCYYSAGGPGGAGWHVFYDDSIVLA